MSPQLAPEVRTALRHARLVAEHDAVVAAVPNDWREQFAANLAAGEILSRRRQDLERGTGAYADSAVGEAARDFCEAHQVLARAEAVVHSPFTPWRQNRRAIKEADLWRGREANAAGRWQRLAGPELSRLDREQGSLARTDDDLRDRANSRRDWLSQHPEATVRIRALEAKIDAVELQMSPDEWRPSHAVTRDNPLPQLERTIERGSRARDGARSRTPRSGSQAQRLGRWATSVVLRRCPPVSGHALEGGIDFGLGL